MNILVFSLLILTLLWSVLLAYASETRQSALAERFPWVTVVGTAIVLCVLGLVVMRFGMISRGEVSALPWNAYQREALRCGVGCGVFTLISTLIYNLWTFWIPGHLFANHKKKIQGDRPVYPYVINGLTGLLMSIENSPFYQLLDAFFRGVE
jgi:hypothetical protein